MSKWCGWCGAAIHNLSWSLKGYRFRPAECNLIAINIAASVLQHCFICFQRYWIPAISLLNSYLSLNIFFIKMYIYILYCIPFLQWFLQLCLEQISIITIMIKILLLLRIPPVMEKITNYFHWLPNMVTFRVQLKHDHILRSHKHN